MDTNNFLSYFYQVLFFNGGKYSNENYDQLFTRSMGKDTVNPDKNGGHDLAAEKILLEDAALIRFKSAKRKRC